MIIVNRYPQSCGVNGVNPTGCPVSRSKSQLAGERAEPIYGMGKTELVSVTARLPVEDVAGIPHGSLSAFIRDAIAEKRARTPRTSRPPRSRLGRLLLAARAEYEAAGGKPLSWAEVRTEVARRRGER